MQQPSNVCDAIQTAYWGKLMTLTAATNANFSGKFFLKINMLKYIKWIRLSKNSLFQVGTSCSPFPDAKKSC